MLLLAWMFRRRWLLLLGLILLGLVATLLFHHRPSISVAVPVRALPQHPAIQVYFNHNLANTYLEAYRPLQRPGDDLEAKIIETIDQAHTSIDIAVQEFKLPRIAQALAKKQQAGVRVRVILENLYSRSWSDLTAAEVGQLSSRERARYQEFFQLVDADRDGQLSASEISRRDALKILQMAQIPLLNDTADGSIGSGLMHHKFMVIDGHCTLVTSANWTISDIHGDLRHMSSRGNQNNLLVLESPQLAQIFMTEFNAMWGDGPGGLPDSLFGTNKPDRPSVTVLVGDIPVTVHFSPTPRQQDWQASSNGVIGQALRQARQQADLALFVFSDGQIAEQLKVFQAQGGKIRALIDRSFAYRPYSQLLPMLGVPGCGMQSTWSAPLQTVGAPQLPEGDLLHHKMAVLDRRWVVTGSHNWSAAANHQNDETLLIIDSPVVAAHFQQEFDRLYQSAELGLPPSGAKICGQRVKESQPE